VVRADERLSWPRTIGLGAQHVVAMFGATFVFPIVIGLNPQLAIMMSGIGFRGFLGRIAVFLGLAFGYALSWIFDRVFGRITSFDPAANQVTTHFRVNWDGVQAADWVGFPRTRPSAPTARRSSAGTSPTSS
jgi:xanthine/uracil permease